MADNGGPLGSPTGNGSLDSGSGSNPRDPPDLRDPRANSSDPRNLRDPPRTNSGGGGGRFYYRQSRGGGNASNAPYRGRNNNPSEKIFDKFVNENTTTLADSQGTDTRLAINSVIKRN